MTIIDLHTHTLFSDGVLLPSELVYRAKVNGYGAIAITDHVDHATFDFVIPRIVRAARLLSRHYGVEVIPGVEITYVPPILIRSMVKLCRRRGAALIVIHGETPAETVPPGTNNAAVISGADILAHPGFISKEAVQRAATNGVALEITSRNGHCVTNAHVARMARSASARLVLNSDTHTPENLLDERTIRTIVMRSGLPQGYYTTLQDNARQLLKEIK